MLKKGQIFFVKKLKTQQDGLPRWAYGETWSTPSQQWLQRPQQQQQQQSL